MRIFSSSRLGGCAVGSLIKLSTKKEKECTECGLVQEDSRAVCAWASLPGHGFPGWFSPCRSEWASELVVVCSTVGREEEVTKTVEKVISMPVCGMCLDVES